MPESNNTQDILDYLMRDKICTCDRCTSSKMLADILNKLDDEDQQWVLDFVSSLYEEIDHLSLELFDKTTEQKTLDIGTLVKRLSDAEGDVPIIYDFGSFSPYQAFFDDDEKRIVFNIGKDSPPYSTVEYFLDVCKKKLEKYPHCAKYHIYAATSPVTRIDTVVVGVLLFIDKVILKTVLKDV